MSTLKKEQADIVLAKLNNLWRKPCPCCGSTRGFEFDPDPFDMISVEDLAEAIAGNATKIPTFSVIAGSCRECGYTVSFCLKKLLE